MPYSWEREPCRNRGSPLCDFPVPDLWVDGFVRPDIAIPLSERLAEAVAPRPNWGEFARELLKTDTEPDRYTRITGFTRDYLEALLLKHDGNITHAAKAAGIARAHLHKLVEKYGLKAT